MLQTIESNGLKSENGGCERRDAMKENAAMSELLSEGMTVNAEHSTSSRR